MRFLVPSLLAFAALGGATGQDAKQPVPGKKRQPNLTISKETTYLTEPLDKDGYLDYIKGLNDIMRKGVSPDNNANVLLWKAFGPRPEGSPMSDTFYKLLGIEAPPDKGTYFSHLDRYLRSRIKAAPEKLEDEIWALADKVQLRPWTAKDQPLVADWLKENEKPLALVVEASKRSRYYMPMVTSKDSKEPPSLIGVLLPSVQLHLACGRALVTRAMLHLGEGRQDEAWQDLLACHRLGRLTGQGGTLIDYLVAVAIEKTASDADVAFLDCAKLDKKQVAACVHDLKNLPAMPPLADKMDLCERFMFLDAVELIDRHGVGSLGNLMPLAGSSDKRPKDALEPLIKQALDKINWDPALRAANSYYDRLVAALRTTEREQRQKLLLKLNDEVVELKAKAIQPGELAKAIAGPNATPETRGKILGDLLIALLVPAGMQIQNASDRLEQTQRNLHVAFALAAFKLDHGKYPGKLDELAPKYLANVPLDLFTGKALVYRPAADGYLLYSLGVNGLDEQGRGSEDDPAGDDLSVRMPPPLPK